MQKLGNDIDDKMKVKVKEEQREKNHYNNKSQREGKEETDKKN